jgi:hypothetical protein
VRRLEHDLAGPDHERAALAHCAGEAPEQAAGGGRGEVDQHVAAHHEIPRAPRWLRRRLDQVVAQEHHRRLQRGVHGEAAVGRDEPAPALVVGDVAHRERAVHAAARRGQRGLVDVGREHVEVAADAPPDHRQRVGLLAGRAAGDPDRDRARGRLDHQPGNGPELLRVAVEPGVRDGDRVDQPPLLGPHRVGGERDVALDHGQAERAHPIGDEAIERLAHAAAIERQAGRSLDQLGEGLRGHGRLQRREHATAAVIA